MLLHVLRQLGLALTVRSVLCAIAILTALVIFGAGALLWNGQEWKIRRKMRNLRRLQTSKRNMIDQYDEKYAAPEGSSAAGPVRIKALFIHPVKSCGPVEVDSAVVTKAGLLYDRCFALAVDSNPKKSDDNSTLQFISQRTKPKMSLIQTELWLPHERSDEQDPLVQSGGCLRMKFPEPESATPLRQVQACIEQFSLSAVPQCTFIAPLNPTVRFLRESDLQTTPFTIHYREAHGVDMGRIPPVAEALSKLKKFLGYPDQRRLTLFKCTPDTLTRTDRNLAPLANIGSRAVHGYTDQQPININSISSVQAVSQQLPAENRPLNGLRFRANIWITGATAYDEESWKRCRIVPRAARSSKTESRQPTTLSVVCRTSRCTIPNVDPEKGTFSTQQPAEGKKMGLPQPSTALVKYRTVEDGNKAALGYLGMHTVPEDRDLQAAAQRKADLIVRVGDEIEVLERGEHLYGSTGDAY